MHSYLLNEDVSAFDTEFSGINAVESKAMDPQQRILLEDVYESLESAGMPIEDYEVLQLRDLDAAPT